MRFVSFLLIYLQIVFSCTPVYAGSPFIWGPDSRAQGLQGSGAVFSNGQPIDYNGAVNKIGNNEAVINTNGWSTYADAAGTAPVDCTGGSPSITWTRNTTTPLRGSSDFVLTHSGNRQGEGVSYDFTLDNADTNKTISIGFDVSSSSNYESDDNGIYIYDVTNAALITPSAVNVSKASYNFQATFVATDSTNYRLCVHVASTNNTAYTVQYDNFFVGPAKSVLGVAQQDWTAYTPTSSWVSNTTVTGLYSRNGQQLNASVKAATTGAPTTASLTFTLPSGLSIDSAAMTDTSASAGLLGDCNISDSGSISYRGFVYIQSSTVVKIRYITTTNNEVADVTQAAPITFGNNDFVDCKFSVPIAEWASSSVYLSQATPEYGYNTDTSASNDTTSFGYGPVGALIPNRSVGTAVSKDVQFQTPISSTDSIILEINDGTSNAWQPFGESQRNHDTQSTNEYGASWSYVSTKVIRVTFYQGGSQATDATYGNNGTAWSTLFSAGYRWRVKKIPGTIQATVMTPPTSMTRTNATQLGYQAYYHGTNYNNGLNPNISGPAGLSVTFAAFYPYQDSTGNWFVKFYLEYTITSATSGDVTFANTTFAHNIPVTTYAGSTNTSRSVTQATSGVLLVRATSATTGFQVWGDVPVSSKPGYAY